MNKKTLQAQLTRLIAEYKKLTDRSRKGLGIDLDKLHALEKRKEKLMKELERF
jgi:hypothetical protein